MTILPANLSDPLPTVVTGLKAVFEVQAYDALIVDLWGVIHDGLSPLPGVVACLQDLKRLQKPVFFLSNSPRRIEPLVQHLTHMGISSDLYTLLYSSGESAFQTLKSSNPGPAYLAMAPSHQGLVYDLNLTVTEHIEEASFILNTGPEPLHLREHRGWLEKAANRNIPMICVNPDVHVMSEGKLKLCAGALAQDFESLGGKVSYHGKPYASVYTEILERMPCSTQRILVVGDSLATDILGAHTMGFDSLLVLSGIESNGENLRTLSPTLHQRMSHLNIFPTYVGSGFLF